MVSMCPSSGCSTVSYTGSTQRFWGSGSGAGAGWGSGAGAGAGSGAGAGCTAEETPWFAAGELAEPPDDGEADVADGFAAGDAEAPLLLAEVPFDAAPAEPPWAEVPPVEPEAVDWLVLVEPPEALPDVEALAPFDALADVAEFGGQSYNCGYRVCVLPLLYIDV